MLVQCRVALLISLIGAWSVQTARAQDECSRDSDCVITFIAESVDCCFPMSCPLGGVSVSTQHQELIIQSGQRCIEAGGRRCPIPECAPPRGHLEAYCADGMCAGRLVGDDGFEPSGN